MRSVALVLVAWLAAGTAGLALDPFAPLAAGLALSEERWVGRAAALALAPVAAAACGLPATTLLIAYAATAGTAFWLQEALSPGPRARVLLVAAGLAVAWMSSVAGTAIGTPADQLPIAATMTWAVLHALVCRD